MAGALATQKRPHREETLLQGEQKRRPGEAKAELQQWQLQKQQTASQRWQNHEKEKKE